MSLDLSKKNIPLYLDILRLVKNNAYGEVQFALGVYQGEVANMVTTSFTKRKYGVDNNAQAVADLVTDLKEMVKKHQSGCITFSVTFNTGNIREITLQHTAKKDYRGVDNQ